MLNNPSEGKLLWEPSPEFMNDSNLSKYCAWLKHRHKLSFANYDELWQWSVDQPETFWESIWQFFEIKAYRQYSAVMSNHEMPGVHWFEGSTLNYAEHIFRKKAKKRPAFMFESETNDLQEISWDELEEKTAALAGWLTEAGIRKGDRVVAFLPNTPYAAIGFLAAASIGAIWSSCSPDFGFDSVIDRFKQIEPTVLLAVDGYTYNGKAFDKTEEVRKICQELSSLEQVIGIPYLSKKPEFNILKLTLWDEVMATAHETLGFEALPFDHPIWILYSSGTTGIPKAITHSHGGVLIEHLKLMSLQNDCREGDRFFWYSTTGWMMWNIVMASLLCGSTGILYDGSLAYPDINKLWELAERSKMTSMGISAGYVSACMKLAAKPGKYDLSALRMIGSTGSPLAPEGFDWLYNNVKKDLWLVSLSGGTDVCSAFVGGAPTLPVYSGEIQCRALGCQIEAYDLLGEPVIDEVGELVLTAPMPSMPVFFWNDPGNKRYLSSYFDMFPGIWRHGDWIKITHKGSLIIYGRSDATLNRQGIRIGTSEVYRALDDVPGISDSLIVGIEMPGGDYYMPLFVMLYKDHVLDDALKKKINSTIRQKFSPRHVPDEILEIPDIPYTLSGKKMETPVKRFLQGAPLEKAVNLGSLRNPDSFDYFKNHRESLVKR